MPRFAPFFNSHPGFAELQSATQALRESHEQTRRVLRAVKIRCWKWEIATGRVTWLANPGRLFGREDAPLDSTYGEFVTRIHPEDRPLFDAAMARALAREAAFDLEFRVLEPDASLHWVHSVGEVFCDERGCPVYMEGTVQDIDAAKQTQESTASFARANELLRQEIGQCQQAEERAWQAKLEADRASQAKSQFLANLSHELRTPMNAVLGFAQLMELDEQDESRRESLEQILNGGRHLLRLINEILDIARVEAGRLDLAPEALDLEEIVIEILALMQPLAAARRIELVFSPAAPLPSVEADRHRLRQILINLISNAIKYNRDGGRVVVSCIALSAERLRLTVADSGIGIPAEKLAKLFTPFERLDARGSEIQGAGLGLVLTKGLVEAMAGRIEVTSTVGQGTAIAVELPLSARRRQEETVRTVLYIEDDPAFVRVIERLLGKRPTIRFLAAGNGATGLKMASEHSLDAILLDYHLPDMMGHEVFRRLQQDPRTAKVPVVVISGDPSPALVQAKFNSSAPRYLAKPFPMPEFFAVLDEALESRGALEVR